MPLRNSDGKELSGAQRRKLRKLREEPDAPTKGKGAPKKPRRAPPAPAPAAPPAEDEVGDADESPNPFVGAGTPPIHDTALLIRWGAKVHGLAIHEIANHPEWYSNRREWLRALLGATTGLGVIRDKAAEQQKIDDAMRRAEAEKKKQGLSSADGRKAPPIPRPAGG